MRSTRTRNPVLNLVPDKCCCRVPTPIKTTLLKNVSCIVAIVGCCRIGSEVPTLIQHFGRSTGAMLGSLTQRSMQHTTQQVLIFYKKYHMALTPSTLEIYTEAHSVCNRHLTVPPLSHDRDRTGCREQDQ